METTLNGNRSAAIGNGVADPIRSPARQRSLFPDFMLILREEIDPHFKDVANALYPKLSNEQACAQLSRNLSGRDHRKIGVAELPVIFEVLGSDAEVRVWAAWLRVRGFKAPERVPDPVRVQEELAAVRQGITAQMGVLEGLAASLERIAEATK